MFAVPREQVSRVHASSGTTGKPTVVGYTARRPRHLGRGDGPLDPGRRRPARRPRARGLRLRAVHRRARRALRRRAARLHGGPGQRRHDRAAGAADRRLRAAGDHGDPVVLPGDPRRDGGARASTRAAPASRSASSAPSRGPTRCGARSRRAAASRRSTSTASREVMGPGVSPGGRRDPGRAARLGGPLPARDRRPGHPRGAARRRGGRAGLHLADQAGDAGGPLPHPRPDPAAARARRTRPSGGCRRSPAAPTT